MPPESPTPDPAAEPNSGQATAVTIGNFDGVHLGHASLLEAAREAVGDEGRVVVLSFDPHPATVLRPEQAPPRLTTSARRDDLLRTLGADEVHRLEPTQELLGTEAADFVRLVCSEHQPSFFVEGPDFRFGKDRAGTLDTLRELGSMHGYRVLTIPATQTALRDQSVVQVSSTLTRWLLEHGRVRDAALTLGRPHVVAGEVAQGDRRGRTIGFPTANVRPETMAPGPGVYAAIAEGPGGRTWAAAVNVGTRPTFAGDGVRIEAHLLDDDNTLRGGSASEVDSWSPLAGLPEYGWRIELELISRVRDEVRFSGVDELTGQLRRDVQAVRARIGPVGPTRHGHLESGIS